MRIVRSARLTPLKVAFIGSTSRGLHSILGRVSRCFIEEVIERQRTMPLQVLSEGHKVISHGWVIYPYPCGVPSAHTHSPCLCAVHSEEPPMGEDRLGLTQRTRGF